MASGVRIFHHQSRRRSASSLRPSLSTARPIRSGKGDDRVVGLDRPRLWPLFPVHLAEFAPVEDEHVAELERHARFEARGGKSVEVPSLIVWRFGQRAARRFPRPRRSSALAGAGAVTFGRRLSRFSGRDLQSRAHRRSRWSVAHAHDGERDRFAPFAKSSTAMLALLMTDDCECHPCSSWPSGKTRLRLRRGCAAKLKLAAGGVEVDIFSVIPAAGPGASLSATLALKASHGFRRRRARRHCWPAGIPAGGLAHHLLHSAS